jgi:hypothetical protein
MQNISYGSKTKYPQNVELEALCIGQYSGIFFSSLAHPDLSSHMMAQQKTLLHKKRL